MFGSKIAFMKRLDRRQNIVIAVLTVILAGITALCLIERFTAEDAFQKKKEQTMEFSQESGFYTEDFEVQLAYPGAQEIYYTLDGSQPFKENEAAQLYEAGIAFSCAEEETIYHINCIAYLKDGTTSQVYQQTYLTGTNLEKRYQMPVLSVYGDADELFGYEDGIFVQGKRGEEFLAARPKLTDGSLPGNWVEVEGNRYLRGREAERQVSMTLFQKDGTVLLSQNCGVRLFGGTSRSKNQPSFRLYARSEYDEENRFHESVLPRELGLGNTLTESYKRLSVRNAGSDNGYAFLRSELAGRLSKNAGFQDAQDASPVCVYVNGTYYGVYWFVTTYDETYMKNRYGDYDGEMYIYEGTVAALTVQEEEEEEAYSRLAQEYNEKQAYFAGSDLNQDQIFQELNEFMDVENFLQYLAIEIYLGNEDSLQNNYRTYRYYSEEGEYTPDSVFDGRYRSLLYDLDHTLNYEQVTQIGAYVGKDTLQERLEDGGASAELFSGLLDRLDAREYYIRYTLSLMNGAFSEREAEPVLDEMIKSIRKELKIMYGIPGMLDNDYLAPEKANYEFVEENFRQIKEFLKNRPHYVMESLQNAFGEMTKYTLRVINRCNASVEIDAIQTQNPEFKGTYFEEVPVTLRAQARPGYAFQYWVIYDKVYEEEELTLDASMIKNGVLLVECVCEPVEMQVQITAVKAKGKNDFMEITNFSTRTIHLKDYYLSDDAEDLQKSTLPDVSVAAGESIRVYGKDYGEAQALGQPAVNFNLKAGETLTLSGKDGTVYSQLVLPRLGYQEGIYTWDAYTGTYTEKLP